MPDDRRRCSTLDRWPDPVCPQLGQSRQLTELTADIKAARPDVLIAWTTKVGACSVFAPMASRICRPCGVPWATCGCAMRWTATDAASAAGYVLGAELRACVSIWSFTPVLDLDHGAPASSAIAPFTEERVYRRCSPRA